MYIRKDHNPDVEKRAWPGVQVREGLDKLGYEIQCKYDDHLEQGSVWPCDLIVTWTLWRHTARRLNSDAHQKLGGSVLCMENGFIRSVGGRRYYQLAWRQGEGSGINGQGVFPIGDDSRWKSWNVRMAPWRGNGKHILICAQRGVREHDPDITHGSNWPDTVIEKIRRYTDRPIYFRPHPGNKRPCLPKRKSVDRIIDPHKESLEQNLRGAWCTVVYSSTSATDSILAGVPVCYDGESVMCQDLCGRIKHIENPPRGDRDAVLSKLAWGQWNSDELESGEAFRHVLQ